MVTQNHCRIIPKLAVAIVPLFAALAGCSGSPLGSGLPRQIACNTCHGDQGSPAPPVDTSGSSDSSRPGVGAHREHLSASGWHKAITCEECHRVPTSVNDPGHADTAPPAELDWGSLATAGGAAPAFDNGNNRCSGVYCHGASLIAGGGTNTTPNWTVVNGSQAACGTCHGSPPAGDHPNRSDCQKCHGEVIGAEMVFVGADRHINGEVDVFDGHPPGYREPSRHGQDAKLGKLNCRSCHGKELTGERGAPSCDGCHKSGWRTNCVFCHGGVDNQSGAPPIDLREGTGTSNVTVGTHTKHITRKNHPAYLCSECHSPVNDVLTPGHMFDATPGESEVVFSAGLSTAGRYSRPGCTSLYCHGSGTRDGSNPNFSGGATSCNSCHSSSSSPGTWGTMSGQHGGHLEEGFGCNACHRSVVNANGEIINPDLHVNGVKEVKPLTGQYNPATRTCTNLSCHGTETW